ncbi:MAG: ATP-grasp domain-containing protein [Pseudomonadota bacterium]
MDSTSARALVLDADMVPCLTVARSLGRSGCQVTVASHTGHPLAARSRYVHDVTCYPNPLIETGAFCDWLRKELSNGGYDLVIPVTERTLVPLSARRADFDGHAIAMPSRESLDLVLDKSKTMALAAELGVPVPLGLPVSAEKELDHLTDRVDFPVVVKPTRSIGSSEGASSHLQVTYAFDWSDLRSKCAHALRFGPVLLQEYFQGVGVGVELIAEHGRLVYSFQHRRLHEVPLTGGGSSLRVSESVHPELLKASEQLIAALKWHGVAMVEFKFNPQTGAFCLMEINGRLWGSLPLAVAAGADFPRMLWELFTTGSVHSTPEYREGVYCRLLSRDLHWHEAVLRGGDGVAPVPPPARADIVKQIPQWFSLRHRFDVQSISDPLPGMIDIGNILSAYWSRLRSRLGERWFQRQQKRAWRRGDVARSLLAAKSVLFLCHGNINRSALADVMLRAYAEDSGMAVQSAGFHQRDGRPSDPVMVEIAGEAGVDLGSMRSATIDNELVNHSDVIFVMEKRHHDRLLEEYPNTAGKVFLLGAHPSQRGLPAEIDDPYGESRDQYRNCFERVAEAADNLKAILSLRAEV